MMRGRGGGMAEDALSATTPPDIRARIGAFQEASARGLGGGANSGAASSFMQPRMAARDIIETMQREGPEAAQAKLAQLDPQTQQEVMKLLQSGYQQPFAGQQMY